MKILFVLEHFHPYIGGVEFLFWQLSNELQSHGHQVKVVTTLFDKKLARKEEINNIQIIRVACKNRFAFTYSAIPEIWRSSNDVDIIHTTTYNAAIPSWFVSKLKNKKCVITFHEYWGQLWTKLPYLTTLERIAYRSFEFFVKSLNFSKVVSVSNFTYDALKEAGVQEDKLKRIYNGLDYKRLEKIRSRFERKEKAVSFTFTFVGRLGVSKGLDLIIPAAGKFLKNHPESQFNLVIPKRPRKLYKVIQNLISKSEMTGQIRILHNLPKEELYKTMIHSSCLVVPSYSEGFCFVAAEACALGIPLVSSNKGALAEVVSGRFIRMQEMNVESLIEALNFAHSGNWIEREVEKFELKESIDSYLELYQELISVE